LAKDQASRTPRILLGGQHQPTLLRNLDGFSRQRPGPAFLIQFFETCTQLGEYANDRFDLAVIQAPAAEDAAEVIGQLTRIDARG
jgi:hypothetical protein